MPLRQASPVVYGLSPRERRPYALIPLFSAVVSLPARDSWMWCSPIGLARGDCHHHRCVNGHCSGGSNRRACAQQPLAQALASVYIAPSPFSSNNRPSLPASDGLTDSVVVDIWDRMVAGLFSSDQRVRAVSLAVRASCRVGWRCSCMRCCPFHGLNDHKSYPTLLPQRLANGYTGYSSTPALQLLSRSRASKPGGASKPFWTE
jgi:hypothetical protein